jgi:hypothetical protein
VTTTYVYHEGTGTIIDADECVLVEVPDDLDMTGDDYFDDEIVGRLAEVSGRPVLGGVS